MAANDTIVTEGFGEGDCIVMEGYWTTALPVVVLPWTGLTFLADDHGTTFESDDHGTTFRGYNP